MNEDKEGCGEVTDFSDEEGTSGSHPVYSMTHTEHGGMPTGSFLYDADSPSYKVHTIYCGTTVVGTQPRDGCVLAVVVKTGKVEYALSLPLCQIVSDCCRATLR
jgi:hypothetical protein